MSWESASRTAERLTENCAHSSLSLGSFSPGLSSPLSIRRFSQATISPVTDWYAWPAAGFFWLGAFCGVVILANLGVMGEVGARCGAGGACRPGYSYTMYRPPLICRVSPVTKRASGEHR
ncbi:hypothetical protein FQZ97_1263930 [compost metagenome]